MTDLISKHGGYKNLKSFQMAEIVFDLTIIFCAKYIKSFKLKEQIEGAARGGKQNISEGSQTSGTSKQSELRLVDVARASMEELKNDMLDFIRSNSLHVWTKDDHRALEIRQLAYKTDKSYKTYLTYMNQPESAANCLYSLINQTCFLLDRQLKALEQELVSNGDIKERLNQIKKEKITGNDDDYDKFLGQFGLTRLPNGQVMKK